MMERWILSFLYLNFMPADSHLLSANTACYISVRTQCTSEFLTFERDSNDCPDNHPWLNGDTFLKKYRVTRDQLDPVTNLIKHEPESASSKRGRLLMPVKYQPMVFFKILVDMPRVWLIVCRENSSWLVVVESLTPGTTLRKRSFIY